MSRIVDPWLGSLTSGPALAVRVDTVATVTYVGEAQPGTASSAAAWRIKRLTETGDDAVLEWADGNAGFDNIWDNRLSLSYS